MTISSPTSSEAVAAITDSSARTQADIHLTSAAADRVRWIASRKAGTAARLRLTVAGGGCSGFTYQFSMADEINGDDWVSETDGVALVVDEVSLALLRGSVVDFVESLGGTAFQVRNPNATAGCGCGSSFAI